MRLGFVSWDAKFEYFSYISLECKEVICDGSAQRYWDAGA